LLDNSIKIPIINYRIGLDAIIGLIPGIGDFAGLLVSSVIVLQAFRLGVPRSVLMQMLVNIGIESLIGVVPVVGDFFDATYKANARNVQLLNQALAGLPAARTSQQPFGNGVMTALLSGLSAMIGFVGVGISALVWWLASLR
jgi:hypothetical protein